MEMVRHEAVLKQLDFRVPFRDLREVMDDGFAEFRAFYKGLRGIVLGDLQFTEERFSGRYDQNQMVDADSAPCAAIGLPVPVVLHLRQNLAQRYKKFCTYARI